MIKIEKDGREMEVRTQLQASAFLNSGWKIKEDIPSEVGLTDDVPDGALETNVDGSVNAYDENRNLVGTVDADTVKVLEEEAGEVLQEQGKTKGGKKK